MKMNFSEKVIIALIGTCCLIIVEGQRHRFIRQWPSFSHGEDVAQDPNSVDDSFGWSWGAAGNYPQRPHNSNGDFNFQSDEYGFPGGNNNNVGGFINPQQSNQGVASTPSPVPITAAPVNPSPPVRPAPTQQSSPVIATSVVYSDEFYNCMSQCRTTNEWNPVCGSDNNDYNNIEKLNCANSCGGNVQQLRRGPCRPFGK